MKVVTNAGESIDLGATGATPTVTLKDYSRRVTDEFGVTTVVPRGFSRQLSVRLKVPSDGVDALQRRLADLRATSARWVVDERYAILSAIGFYKDFSLDIPNAAIASCTLTVEGLAETELLTDTGGDPAPNGQSSLRMLRPITITDAALVSSTVAENDYPAWSNAVTYAKGARVILSTTHRIYESAIDGNAGADPAATSGKWIDVGPTNRWAAFDQALGTSMTAQRSLSVTIVSPGMGAVALLDVTGGTVRVQATGYDRTDNVGPGAMLFLDLPADTGRVTITIAGPDAVSVGTLLVGSVVGLGTTEASPTAGISDYSRKETDEFGEVMVVPRAWAKRMDAKAAIATTAIDNVFARIAAVRATPVLWIGGRGLDALTIYGFYKAASLEVGTAISKLSLSIEGLSTAGKVEPFAPGGGSVAWPDITDPTGTKPADNADKTSLNTSKDTTAVAGKPAGEVVADLNSVVARARKLDTETIPAVEKAVSDAGVRITAARQAADDALAGIDEETARALKAEGRLDERISSVAASGGYDDTALRAEITRIDTAYANGDVALGRRIDTVQSGLDGVDGKITAQAQELTTAFSGADQALASRTETLEASMRSAPQYLNRQATFSDWSDSRITPPISTPGGWGLAAATSSAAQVQRVEGIVGRYAAEAYWPGGAGDLFWAVSGFNFGDAGGGVDSALNVNAGWYVVEMDVSLIEGTLSGAGGYLAAYNGNGVLLGEATFHLPVTPDATGVAPGAGTPGKRYRFAYMAALLDDRTASLRFHPMTAWQGFAAAPDQKRLRWHLAGVRPATADEIANRKARTVDLPAAVARIKRTEDTLADLPNLYAAASRATALEAQVNGEGNSRLLARASEQATTIADAKAGAVATTYQGITAALDGRLGSVEQKAGAIAGIDGRTTVYWEVLGTTSDGQTMVRLSKSDGSRGVFYVGADMVLDGSLLVAGTVTTQTIAPGSVTAALAITGSDVRVDPGRTVDNASGVIRVPSATAVRLEYRLFSNYFLQAGSGSQICYASIIRIVNGAETEVFTAGLPKGLNSSNWVLDFPPDGDVKYLLRFRDYQGSGGSYYWQMSQIQLSILGFKR